ncbi:MAG: hypothetical protein LBR80_00920 [Deltaproteobacteria bacterium]|jgi:hypothetical protein|nr:hypothetical protein [Deltaproteobacteria bacterium]
MSWESVRIKPVGAGEVASGSKGYRNVSENDFMMTGSTKDFRTVLAENSLESGTRHDHAKDYFTASKSIYVIDHDNEGLLTVLGRDCGPIADKSGIRYEQKSFSPGNVDNISGVILE